MYLPRSYATCLTLLSKSSERDRGRTYCNNKNELLFVSKEENKILKGYVPIYKYIYQTNYLNEGMPIMSFYPTKFPFLC